VIGDGSNPLMQPIADCAFSVIESDFQQRATIHYLNTPSEFDASTYSSSTPLTFALALQSSNVTCYFNGTVNTDQQTQLQFQRIIGKLEVQDLGVYVQISVNEATEHISRGFIWSVHPFFYCFLGSERLNSVCYRNC
jgi:hypothetical protein